MKSSAFVKLLLIVFCIGLQACSFHMEKRRYRPGYHLETIAKVSKRNNGPSVSVKEPLLKVEKEELKFKQISSISRMEGKDSLLRFKKNNTSKTISTQRKKQGTVNLSNSQIHFPGSKSIHKFSNNKLSMGKNPKEVKSDSKKRRRVWGWTLGATSFALFIGSILALVLMSASYAGNIFMFGIILLFAMIFATIALIVRFKKYNTLPETNEDPEIKSKHTKASFILSIISAAAALIGFVLSFIFYPVGLVGFSLAIPALITSIISFIMGLVHLKGDKSVRNILGIILAALAILLAIAALVVFFL
jgi:hypothetical protein